MSVCTIDIPDTMVGSSWTLCSPTCDHCSRQFFDGKVSDLVLLSTSLCLLPTGENLQEKKL